MAAFVSALIALLADNIFHYNRVTEGFSLWILVTEPFIATHMTELMKYLIIISFGLFAVYLKNKIEDKEIKPTFKDFKKTITSENWNSFFIATGLYCLLYLLTFKELFDTQVNDTGAIEFSGFPGDSDSMNRKLKFLTWINSIIELVKGYLPYIGAMYIVLSDYYDKIDKEVFKKFKIAFITIIILALCTEAISDRVIWYLDYYIINLIKVPFKNEIVSSIFQFFVYIVTGAYFYLAFAGAILFPILTTIGYKTKTE